MLTMTISMPINNIWRLVSILMSVGSQKGIIQHYNRQTAEMSLLILRTSYRDNTSMLNHVGVLKLSCDFKMVISLDWIVAPFGQNTFGQFLARALSNLISVPPEGLKFQDNQQGMTMGPWLDRSLCPIILPSTMVFLSLPSNIQANVVVSG